MSRALDALRALVERFAATRVPPPLPRACPGCEHDLSFGCRVIREDGAIEVVRCICGTHSAWDRSPGYPVLVGYERGARVVTR